MGIKTRLNVKIFQKKIFVASLTKFLIPVRRKILMKMIKTCILLVCSFISGFLFVAVFVLLFGYRIYTPVSPERQFPLKEPLCIEKIASDDYCEPESFTQEEQARLLEILQNTRVTNFLKKSESPTLPFFSETLESPFYAVKAIIPFSHSYFLFDENGYLVGAHLSESDSEEAAKIIRTAGARLKEKQKTE